jgi:predicted RNA binding protein YcfA (HicA-like mRNA interferase family)
MPRITPLSWKELVRIFEKEGFVHQRTTGDHMVFTKSGLIRPLVIPKYNHVPIFIIQNLLRTSGINRERYFQLLTEN